MTVILSGCVKSGIVTPDECTWSEPFLNYIERGVIPYSDIEYEILKHNESWELFCGN